MSGQYPGGYNSPVGGHRGNFSTQQQQMVNMNQMVQNQMGMMGGYNQNVVVGGVGVGGGMMSQQQQNPLQNPVMGNIVPPVMNAPGMQSVSPIHQQQGPNPQALIVQQLQQQQLQQQQLQQQQQQMPQQSPQTQQQPNVGPVGQPTQLSLQASSNQPGTGGSIMQQPNLPHSMAQPSNMLGITQPLPHKEINIVALSRLGQETVQDITSRFQEIFAALKVVQPTTSNRESSAEKKVQEYLRTIRLLFKRVRIIYEKCNDGYPQGMEYTHVESLIPYKDEPDHRSEPTQCEEYRKALQENRDLIETVTLKNKQLREIIDRTRIIIWEINTMLSMRRS